MQNSSIFSSERDGFNNLAIRDLLEARDLYHAFLLQKRNVIATAIGRYLIRKGDPRPGSKRPRSKGKKGKRTFFNSEIRDYSWPCLIVVVDSWEPLSSFSGGHANHLIPKALYMPDGRSVPVCVIEATRADSATTAIDPAQLIFPKNMIAGGFPIYARVQGEDHIASVGCVVSDGHRAYAITNRHVAGEEGSPIYSRLANQEVEIGLSSSRQLSKVAFTKFYPNWPGHDVFVNADIGLVDLHDLRQWKTEIYGIGPLQEPADLGAHNMTLKLIGAEVMAHGAVSGRIEGKIIGLFYRYKTLGGAEYVADFLIGPKGQASLVTHHGDSGTLFLVKSQERWLPFAIQWGAHEFVAGTDVKRLGYALATGLSNVCRELDVDLVRGWNIDQPYTWGKTGHFKIAARACELVSEPGLKKLMMANQKNIGYVDDDLMSGEIVSGKFTQDFVPLADVADIIWRTTRPSDESNHFSDIDEVDPDVFEGKSLLELSLADDANIDIDVWLRFDREMDKIKPNFKRDRQGNEQFRPREGALPFRVWQMYRIAIEALKAKKVEAYVCAVGTMAHYVGDACQPLHISFLHHGATPEDSRVHSDYETTMIDRKMSLLFPGVNGIDRMVKAADLIGPEGKDAARRVLQLMQTTVDRLPPSEVLQVWRASAGAKKFDKMWAALGPRTIQNIADGCLTLATLWQSAWQHGNGKFLPASKLVEIDHDTLMGLYNNRKFVPSFRLSDPAYKEALAD